MSVSQYDFPLLWKFAEELAELFDLLSIKLILYSLSILETKNHHHKLTHHTTGQANPQEISG